MIKWINNRKLKMKKTIENKKSIDVKYTMLIYSIIKFEHLQLVILYQIQRFLKILVDLLLEF